MLCKLECNLHFIVSSASTHGQLLDIVSWPAVLALSWMFDFRLCIRLHQSERKLCSIWKIIHRLCFLRTAFTSENWGNVQQLEHGTWAMWDIQRIAKYLAFLLYATCQDRQFWSKYGLLYSIWYLDIAISCYFEILQYLDTATVGCKAGFRWIGPRLTQIGWVLAASRRLKLLHGRKLRFPFTRLCKCSAYFHQVLIISTKFWLFPSNSDNLHQILIISTKFRQFPLISNDFHQILIISTKFWLFPPNSGYFH